VSAVNKRLRALGVVVLSVIASTGSVLGQEHPTSEIAPEFVRLRWDLFGRSFDQFTGWSLTFTHHFGPHFGIAAEGLSVRASSGSSDASIFKFGVGPRWSSRPQERVAMFFQTSFGSMSAASGSRDSGLYVTAAGGVELAVRRWIALRMATGYPLLTDDRVGLQVSFGPSFRFRKPEPSSE